MLQNYSQAFFPIEIRNVILQPHLLFAGGHSTLTFDMYKKKEREILPKISVKLIPECYKILFSTLGQFIVRLSLMKFKIFGTI